MAIRTRGVDRRMLQNDARAYLEEQGRIDLDKERLQAQQFDQAKRALTLTGDPAADAAKQQQFAGLSLAKREADNKKRLQPAPSFWVAPWDPSVRSLERTLHNADVEKMAESQFGPQSGEKLSMSDEGFVYMPKGVTNPGSIGYDWHEAGYGSPGAMGVGEGDARFLRKELTALGPSLGLAQQRQYQHAQDRYRKGKGIALAPSQWDGFHEAAQEGANLQSRINDQWTRAQKGLRNAY